MNTLTPGEWLLQGLKGNGSSFPAPPSPQRSSSMEHGKQEVQPTIPLGRSWTKLPENVSQIDTLQRTCGNHQRVEPHQTIQTPGGEGDQDKGETSHYTSNRRTAEPDRA
ncbi:hypothetical protein O181_012608 [Austropuccinia psidii MF-1]|uniref:Uncharacterized protein n=1 Tax=Austropuccinia psidii MF-1 TaxID=1389203 RepID=A0A9Q3BX31_9BASI|nr:hypothetical protein [Austropuccinia psidii MF-1]